MPPETLRNRLEGTWTFEGIHRPISSSLLSSSVNPVSHSSQNPYPSLPNGSPRVAFKNLTGGCEHRKRRTKKLDGQNSKAPKQHDGHTDISNYTEHNSLDHIKRYGTLGRTHLLLNALSILDHGGLSNTGKYIGSNTSGTNGVV